METKASSVTEMVKKLSEKKLVNYKKYQGVKLSEKGKNAAVEVIRRHRLWEYFLVEKLISTGMKSMRWQKSWSISNLKN